MDRKKTGIGIIFGAVLLAAVCADAAYTDDAAFGTLTRGKIGEGEQEVTLLLNAEGVLTDYPYSVSVSERRRSKEEAEELFKQAKDEIDESFYREGEDASHVTEHVCPEAAYASGAVSADWSFSDYQVISPDGVLLEENIAAQGALISATAELSCDGYREEYVFPFAVFQGEKTKEELLLTALGSYFDAENSREGTEVVALPAQIDGISLSWGQKREYISLKVFVIEALILILLPLARAEAVRKKKEERKLALMLEYPVFVNKLAVLIGAGMSVAQAWNKISASYSDKRQKRNDRGSVLGEELQITSRELKEGGSERLAYEKFGERIAISCYYRLVRILISNLRKGSNGMTEMLNQESVRSFEEKVLLAKRMGEEASTKMIFPLVLMLGIVMGIVVAPAIIDFMG